MGKEGTEKGIFFHVLLASYVIYRPNTTEDEVIPGHAGGQGYDPPPLLASGSHCSNVRTLCSRPSIAPKIRGARA